MKKMYACSNDDEWGIDIILITISHESHDTVIVASVDKVIMGSNWFMINERCYKHGSYAFFSTWPEVQTWLHDTIGHISDSIAQEQARLQELIELVDKKEEEL